MIKRLLFYLPSLSAGGAERVCSHLANYWAEAGHQVLVATLSAPETDHYRLHASVKRYSLGLLVASGNPAVAVWRNMQRIQRLRGLLRKVAPDAVVAFMAWPSVILAFARVGFGHITCIGSERMHSPSWPLGPIWERLRSVSYGWLDGITALTEASAVWLRMHTRARRVAVIPNPIPYPLPDHPPYLDPSSVGMPRRKRLLAIGRLSHEKGFDLLLASFSELARNFESWELVILGEGRLRPDLERQIATLGLSSRVYLPGVVGNVGAWLSSADLFVLSSRSEGFGNVLGEALAYGLPAVSFDCDSGPRAIVRHEVDGLLVPAGDTAGLSNALSRLMRDDHLRAGMAARATEARQRFAIHRVAGAWEQLIESLRESRLDSRNDS